MMTTAWITLLVTLLAVLLFITEWLTIDLVAMLILLCLVITGVISPSEGLAGFSNEATLTVAFMFVLSAALLKTGALQLLAQRMAGNFRTKPLRSTFWMFSLVALVSAFVNNTPVVAVFIPVVIQLAATTKIKASRLLIPLSFASILGGMCTLIGTSTNILVSGIAKDAGLAGFDMFTLAPVGLPILLLGLGYIVYAGQYLLPDREEAAGLSEKFDLHEYMAEFVLLEGASIIGNRIMDSPLVRELDMDIIEIRRADQVFTLPPGDFLLAAGDTLKVRCDRKKIRALKDWVRLLDNDSQMQVMGTGLQRESSSLVEMVVTPSSPFVGKTLRAVDFRRSYRAVPLAIRHREAIVHEQLYNLPLMAGDVILAEVKTHYLTELKQLERMQDSPFILLSADEPQDFQRGQFYFVLSVVLGVVALATAGWLPISIAALLGVCILVAGKAVSMQEAYEAIDWKIIFLLAGALSLGKAMSNSGLDFQLATLISGPLGDLGPYALVAGLYLITGLLTEIMSNNATAALIAPIAIATAQQLNIDPLPLLITITLAASASFLTPVGYQTNTMVYSAGQYKFADFFRIGIWISLICWLFTTLLVVGLFM